MKQQQIAEAGRCSIPEVRNEATEIYKSATSAEQQATALLTNQQLTIDVQLRAYIEQVRMTFGHIAMVSGNIAGCKPAVQLKDTGGRVTAGVTIRPSKPWWQFW